MLNQDNLKYDHRVPFSESQGPIYGWWAQKGYAKEFYAAVNPSYVGS